MKLRLLRVAHHATGTYGVLSADGLPFAVTLERPWLNNESGKSCIPVGTYTCRRVNSPHFGNTFDVEVPGRSLIRFHKGNLDDDSHGCILVGEEFDPVLGSQGITASEKGFAEFLAKTQAVDEFTLEVVDA